MRAPEHEKMIRLKGIRSWKSFHHPWTGQDTTGPQFLLQALSVGTSGSQATARSFATSEPSFLATKESGNCQPILGYDRECAGLVSRDCLLSQAQLVG